MGTRGSLGFIVEDKEYLNYNHFDSYPDGLGQTVLEFITEINKENGWEQFKENAKNVVHLKGNRVTDTTIQEKYRKYSNLSVSEKTLEDPYCLFREIQDSWMYEIYKGELQHFFFDNNFIKDSLFCEYAYIINLDTMKLEFYDGFQKKVQKNNRFGEKANKDGYYPSRLVGVFNLEDIRDSDYINNLVEKMNEICKSQKDDPSVSSYFRKPKLQILNEKSLL